MAETGGEEQKRREGKTGKEADGWGMRMDKEYGWTEGRIGREQKETKGGERKEWEPLSLGPSSQNPRSATECSSNCRYGVALLGMVSFEVRHIKGSGVCRGGLSLLHGKFSSSSVVKWYKK